MDEVEVCVHTFDGTPCDSPPPVDREPCGHGFDAHHEWVKAEPPC